jgi:putative endonuclease
MFANPTQRLKDHNAGRTNSTKGYRPWVLIHKEEFATKEAARARELYLKTGAGREYIAALYKS